MGNSFIKPDYSLVLKGRLKVVYIGLKRYFNLLGFKSGDLNFDQRHLRESMSACVERLLLQSISRSQTLI